MPPRNMNPMLPTLCHLPLPLNNMLNSNLPTGQSNFTPLRSSFSQQFEIPVRRPPPLLQVPVSIPSNRSTLNDSHPMLTGAVLLFSERQSNNYLPASRQPTSLLWILSLVRRIKSVTLSVIIDNFITLTPFQLFALFQNQHEFTHQSAARMIELLVKSILQAPGWLFSPSLFSFLLYIYIYISTSELASTRSDVFKIIPQVLDFSSPMTLFVAHSHSQVLKKKFDCDPESRILVSCRKKLVKSEIVSLLTRISGSSVSLGIGQNKKAIAQVFTYDTIKIQFDLSYDPCISNRRVQK